MEKMNSVKNLTQFMILQSCGELDTKRMPVGRSFGDI